MTQKETVEAFFKYTEKLEKGLKRNKVDYKVKEGKGIILNNTDVMGKWVNGFMATEWGADLVLHGLMNVLGSLVGQTKEYKEHHIAFLVKILYGNEEDEVLN